MSASESKKTKRRKIKNAVTKTNASTNVSVESNLTQQAPSQNLLEDKEKQLEEIIKSTEDLDVFSVPCNMFSKGPNPYITKENCLLCGCERIDPPEAEKLKHDSMEFKCTETETVTKLPLWVCAACRKAADTELLDKRDSDIPFLDEDLQPETIPFPFLTDINLDSTEPFTPNGTICNCEACKERRQIAEEYNKETHDLQKCWVELRKIIQILYQSEDPYLSESEHIQMTDLVVKLCSRDAHQLFLRLESLIRDLVIEKKVRLVQQLNKGVTTLSESQQFIHMLLEEYGQLCRAARVTSECLADLKDHLKRFKVTWDLHNKHLFQNIVYSYPAIHHNLPVIRDTLRRGVANPDMGEETYPNLLCRFLKYQDEMSVILVVWRDCQLLIENYNEEQTKLKVKQKWLKEDWEFFKDQRKLLEQQVLKNPKAGQNTHNMEAQFTETMRNLLQGTRPSVEERHCPRCNRKRCPCDECTITHMITCGIINPEALENPGTNHTFNFPHDPNFPPDSSNYFLDVHPPSVSSSNCSSGSVSPIMVDPERLIQPFGDCPEDFETVDNIREEIIDDSQSDDSDDELDDDEDDEDDDDDLEDDEEADCNDGFDIGKSQSRDTKSNDDLRNWINESTKADCDCHHCVGPKAEQMFQDPYPCQCRLCLQQPTGHLLNTPLPQHVPLSPHPTDLQIYPHIHGYPGIPGIQPRHVRSSILQPQLYNLHNQLQGKLPGKIDFDNPGSMQEHIYPAFGDWDNDPHYLGSQFGGSFPTDLLPPPPLTTNNPFITDPALSSHHQQSTIPVSSSSTSSAFKTVAHSHVPSQNITCSSSHNVHYESCAKVSSSSCSVSTPSLPAKTAGPPCSRPATLGGNASQTTCTDKGHSQHCLKHNHQVDKAGFDSRGHGKPTPKSQHLPSNLTQTNLKHVNNTFKHNGNVKHGGKEDVAGKCNSAHPNTTGSAVPTSCSHGNKVHKQVSSPHHARSDGHPTSCQNTVSLPTSINNVSVGTSTLCTDPDYDNNNDDNCDSIEDTCSDKSSSTSSNQKEGKYCDCCYCEFFGHGNQPVSQTSKKVSEMKEKLRRRLKHRSETSRCEDEMCRQQTACHQHGCHNKKHENKPENKGLEELINFINGDDVKSKSTSKKQRQKQRKAEEKARQEETEERKRQKAERKLRKRVQTFVLERTESINSQDSIGKKPIKKVACADASNITTTPTAVSANPPIFCPKEQGTVKGKGSKLKDDSNRKSMNSPTTLNKELKDGKGSRPQTPKQQQHITNQQKTVKQEQKSSKNDARNSPVPESSNKNTPGRKNISCPDPSLKVSQSAVKYPSKEQTDVLKTAFNNNSTKIGQHSKSSTANEKSSVIDTKSSSPRVSKMAADKSIKRKEALSTKQSLPTSRASQAPVNKSTPNTNQVKSNPVAMAKSTRIVNQVSDKSTPVDNRTITPAPVAKTITTQSQKSKKREVKPVPNGFVQPVLNGDVSVKNPVKSSPANGSIIVEKLPETIKVGKTKNKKKKKKGKGEEFDEIFLPRSESDIENGELDDMEKEIEDFKRFCLDSPQPPVREKMQVNINLKDILSKKKMGLGC